MIRSLVKTVYILLLFFIVLAGILTFLMGTNAGLHTVIELSPLYLPGKLKIQHIEGTLFNSFALSGLEYKNKSIEIKIKHIQVQWQPHSLHVSQLLTAQWHDMHGKLMAQDKILKSEEGTLTATGILPNLQINVHSKLSTMPEDHWLMDTKIRGILPWHWTFEAGLTHPSSALSKNTVLDTNLSVTGKITAKNKAHVLLTIRPGFYHAPNNDALPVLHFKGGVLKVTLSPKELKGSGELVIDQNKQLNLDFQVPHFTLDTGLKDNQPLKSEWRLKWNSLDFLQKISPEITQLKGQVNASLKVTGTLRKKNIESQLILSKTRFSIPLIGLNVDDFEVKFHGNDKSWVATAAIKSSEHYLSLSGKGTLNTQFTADFALEGTDFPLIKTSEYQIHISPKLDVHVTPTTQSLSGSILIPYAEIKPRTFHNSISLPEDVVYKHKEKASSAFDWLTTMDVAIEMGKEVLINVKGLKGHLDGTLHAKQLTQGSINAYGELSVRQGTYKAYGQDLAIKQGQLIFTGGPINNPGLNVRATKKINTTPTTFSSSNQLLDFNSNNAQQVNFGETMTLGVEVTGRLTHPKVQLFSDPAVLSQADILSMLVLGRPANQANKAGGQLLLTAISSMNLGSDTNSLKLLEQLKQSSGIDFNVQTNTNYNQVTHTVNDSTAFVVGKSLSKRLYLSYNIGLSQTDTNMLTLRYLLNKFFSIQVTNSDTSSAIDFLYTSNKKSKH